MSIDPHIFRAYDIRGKAHSQLSTEACESIGKAFGTVVRRKTKKAHPVMIVGRDARTHGPDLEAAVIRGLVSTGCAVKQIDDTPSPVNYFTICKTGADGGIQVTASHNPKDDNGLKLNLKDAEAFSGDDIQALRQQIEKKDFIEGTGTVEKLDGVKPYIAHLTKLFSGVGKNVTIVVDAGNGIPGPVNCEVLRAVGATVIELYTEPDGEFPNHPADPSRHTTLKELQETVTAKHAHIGFGFDGDGDRLGVVDETGKILSADEVLLMLAKDHLKRHHGSPIVFTVSNSENLNTEIERWGGKAWMTKVGHSYVEHAMIEQKSLLGGEQSGHFFCGEDYYGFDDALVAALRVLMLLRNGKTSVSALTAEFPKVFQAHERRPYCPDEKKGAVIESVIVHFQKTHPVITLDGARIDFGNGAWAGIRQSNTSPCLSICIEARSTEELQKVEEEVLDHMKKYPEIEWKE